MNKEVVINLDMIPMGMGDLTRLGLPCLFWMKGFHL